ncbi:lysophospholipid acyltransferase family protein [Catellatospora bangladeshensis]|uniref:1-acyl-sn-glycerol-3-phosphate acyltransferase n=1 Tax=Catellatospora bangladeshensis TaxID=310355 RepID=A0A8J3JN95_9ACTN|nr:lysophospholipid acyltransferase family protein [Catellatospora bangladeshensis]GIF83797.1 1-acyl-sn-glycerol-3-phosphate acyltransferase [Catellatospora bangladeshensis]
MARRRLGFWQRFAVCLVKPPMIALTRRDWRGWEHIPAEGGVILAVNHVSHADPFTTAHYVYDSGRWPQFLGKESVFRIPLAGRILHWCKQIPVHRGTADAVKALDAAVDAVRQGACVVIYPEGTTTKEPELWPMRGKTGVARLALATGAPVIPVATWGPEKIFDPRTKKVRLLPKIPVSLWAGPPVDLSKWAGAEPTGAVLNEMTDAVMLRLRDMLAEIRGETPPPLWGVRDDSARNDAAGNGQAKGGAR